MKHTCERDLDRNNYVANGELIAAAMFLNVRCQRVPDSPHARLAVSESPRGWRERDAAEREAAREASSVPPLGWRCERRHGIRH